MGMVFLALSANGLREALTQAASNNTHVWCGADAIPESDYNSYSHHAPLTRFSYNLLGEPYDILSDALETIREHHPTSIIFVERP